MCGRYVVTNPVNKTKKIVKTSIKVENDVNYNAHPSQELPIIKKYSNGFTLEKAKWGIIPSWAKKKDFKALINARLETINEKVSFKNLIKKTRCVSVMDGFCNIMAASVPPWQTPNSFNMYTAGSLTQSISAL